MTTARNVIAEWLVDGGFASRHLAPDFADGLLAKLQISSDSVRLELAGILNSWRPIETAPKDVLREENDRLRAEAAQHSTSPLPDEIEDYCDTLISHANWLDKQMASPPAATGEECRKAAAAIRRMARAHEVLKGDCAECFAENERLRAGAPLTPQQRERIDAIKAQREAEWEKLQARIRELEAERDAIRTKTIEEIIAAMDKAKTWGEFEKWILALNQPPEAGEGKG